MSKAKGKAPDAHEGALSRREWVSLAGILGLGGVSGLLYLLLKKDGVDPALLEDGGVRLPEPDYGIFSAEQGRLLAAASDTVLPGDSARGFAAASEAGAILFLSKTATASPAVRAVLADLCGELTASHFLAMNASERVAAFESLAALPNWREVVEMLTQLTLRGYSLPPHHGGNRDERGWTSLGIAREIPEPAKRAVAWKEDA